MRHLVSAAALAATLLAACSESSTAPEINAPENGTVSTSTPTPSFSATLPGTSVTITSGLCTQISTVSPTTGDVRCDYSISNPDGIMLNIYPEARMILEYQCVSPSTGKVQSTGIGGSWAYAAINGVTAINPTGTNVQLSTATMPNTYVKKYNKLNACKGRQVVVVTKATMEYWDIYVDNWYSGQPGEQYKSTCLGQDDRYGCQSALIE
jgi:hypothetical protein